MITLSPEIDHRGVEFKGEMWYTRGGGDGIPYVTYVATERGDQ